MTEDGKRKAGRPALAPEERKSSNLTIRMRQDFRDQLQRAATANHRSISEEAETRITSSFADDVIGNDLADLHEWIRRYLRLLGRRKVIENFDLSDPTIAAALRAGFAIIIDAAGSTPTPLSEERVKKFFMEDVAGMANATNVAFDAFNVLDVAGLAKLDVFKLSEWIRANAKTGD